MAKIHMISLGCAKNLVNSEQMLYLLTQAGHEIVPSPEGADVAVVNTCGFIDSAKSEAIENIIELGQLKAAGTLDKIVVAGCLPQRYQDEILDELPEIDALVGVGSFDAIVEAVDECLQGAHPALFGDKNAPQPETDRVVTTGPGWAYLKIAEGCDNYCAFCVIPYIRGRYRSRRMEDILREARELAALGIKELIIVAQDITRYGQDLYGKPSLTQLLEALLEIEEFHWIRLHYLYPDLLDDSLIDLIAREDRIVKYLDIPIQHIDDTILRRMCRRGTGAEIRALFQKLREKIPGLVLRTSLISGLPGEGEAEFEALCAFLREAKIERAGVFVFSPEEGTPAAKMPDRCDTETAVRRAELIQEIQAQIMDEWSSYRIGETLEILCEGYDRAARCWYGRSYADSPDVDGKVFFMGKGEVGEFIQVRITDVLDGDLIGESKDDNCE